VKVVKAGSTALNPVPAVLISCGSEKPNLITLAWVGIACSQPPAITIAVRPERWSHGLIVEAGEFVVNLPRADQLKAVDYCGHVSGRDVDKWAACGFTPVPAKKVRIPLVAECPVALECRTRHRLSLGTHDLFVAEVLAVQADEAVLNKQGQVDYEQADLIAYANGDYFRLGDKLGTYGDWRVGIK
jgi:flavin reductase (DIM6/NTAB) family NADH-FMN oxidoreductase RutF